MDMNKENLYFIALVPDIQLREDIEEIKKEVCKKYHSCHALKSPAHITLQRPFKRKEQEEHAIAETLQNIANNQKSFEVTLNRYGAFPPKVIYINAEPIAPIVQLHSKLKKHLTEKLNFTDKELSHKITPHLTIANHDLKPDMFNQAWNEFKNLPFEAHFEATSIFLLKHNGKHWNINCELKFKC
jgi:2'-5' RNA ligase